MKRRKTLSSNVHGVIDRRKMAREITARQAHSVPHSVSPPTGRPRRPPLQPRAYMALLRWLEARGPAPVDGAAVWVSIARLADMATRDLNTPVNPSALGYVIRKYYPDMPQRIVKRTEGDLYTSRSHRKEYDIGFLTRGLD